MASRKERVSGGLYYLYRQMMPATLNVEEQHSGRANEGIAPQLLCAEFAEHVAREKCYHVIEIDLKGGEMKEQQK